MEAAVDEILKDKKIQNALALYEYNLARSKEYYERNKEKVLLKKMKKWRATHEPAPPGGRGRPRKNIEV
jgi:hypothetical protein